MESATRVTRVLLLRGSCDEARRLQTLLQAAPGGTFELAHQPDLEQGLAWADEEGTDLLLLDLGAAGSEELDSVEEVLGRCGQRPLLVLTDSTDHLFSTAVVNRGAQDVLPRGDLTPSTLSRAVLHGLQRQSVVGELRNFALRMHTNHFRLQTILEQNADGIVITNRKGEALYVNPAAERLFARPRHEMLGRPLTQLVAARDSSEFEVVRPGNHRVMVQVRLVRIDWDGETAHLASLRDVTEQHRLRQSLHRAADEWQRTFDAVEDMVLLLDHDFRVVRANRAAQEALGGQLCGRRCYELIHGTSEQLPDCPAQKTIAEGKVAHLELQEEHLGNRWFHVATYPVPGEENAVPRVVHVVRSIDERKRSEQILRTLEAKRLVLEELQHLSEMKTHFLELVAHEMRTPMTVVQSGMELLLDQSIGPLNERQQRFVRMMDRNIDRLTRFSTNVLHLSRLDTDTYPVLLDEVPLATTLEPTLEMLQVKAAAKGLNLETDLTLFDGVTVNADQNAVGQVLFNLVNNAITHCEAGVRVLVRGRPLNRHWVEVSVSDTGSGIDPEHQKRIFDRFFQVQRPDRGPGYRGSGIGLAVTKGLVEKMGGQIAVESSPGEGSTFRFTLRRASDRPQTIFGRIAVQMGLTGRKEVNEAARKQQPGDGPRHLIGALLVQSGALAEGDVARVLARQEETLSQPHPLLGRSLGQVLFGRLAVSAGFIEEAQLHEALRLLALERDSGRQVRLGQVMVEQKMLSVDQAVAVLGRQRKVLLRCPGCRARYLLQNEPGAEEELPSCPRCRGTVERVLSPETLKVDQTIHPAST